jgi:hypothetical protein
MICIFEPMVNMAGLLAGGAPEVAALADKFPMPLGIAVPPGGDS